MKKIVIGVWLSFVLSLFSVSQAQEAPVQLKEVLVTADRIEQSTGETTSDVVVIKGEDIKKANIEFVADALRQVPDINIVQNGGPGQIATMFLRGGDSTQTLVMIDGVKVKSTTFGAFDFSGLRVDDIERIEIVKGPQSTLYGSEAMSGVVNIITKKGTGAPKVEAAVEAGSFETHKASIAISGGGEKVDYRLSASTLETAGISAASAGTERDGYRDGSVSGKVGFKPSDKFEFDLSGSYHHDHAELDGFSFVTFLAADDPNYVQYGDHTLISAQGKAYLLTSWEQILTVSAVRDALRARDPDTAFNDYTITTGMDTVDWQHNLFLHDQYTLTVGVESRKETGEIKGSFDRYIYNKAGYLNNRLKFFQDKLILNAGLRHDDHETTGAKSTYRFGALYDVQAAGLKVKGNYGTGFRAPTFNELFYPSYGNLSLLPESSTAWDLGLEKSILQDRGTVSVTYFDQNYQNLIESSPTGSAINIARAEIKGIETDISLKASEHFTLRAGHTYLDARDKDTGNRLTRRPTDKFTLAAVYSADAFSATLNYSFVGERFDSSAQRNLASYNLVNMSGTFALSKGLSLFGRIDNLFNTKYEEAGGYGTPGLSAIGGIKVTLL